MISKLLSEQRPLVVAGIISFLGFLVTALLTQIDSTQILGIDRWIKPAKFFISIAIFVWTIAIYLYFLKGREFFSRIASWGMIVIFAVEMTAIVGQAARGTTSHFNVSNAFDGAVFTIMGIAIALNTIVVGVLTYYYFRAEFDLSPTILLGMRLGLLIFLIGSIEGGYMASQTGHTVGATDGGPGLPLTNWSTVAGDLRVAHFLGLHSLQAVPIVGILLERFRVTGRTALTIGFGVAYFVIIAATFLQAVIGKPLLAV